MHRLKGDGPERERDSAGVAQLSVCLSSPSSSTTTQSPPKGGEEDRSGLSSCFSADSTEAEASLVAVAVGVGD